MNFKRNRPFVAVLTVMIIVAVSGIGRLAAPESTDIGYPDGVSRSVAACKYSTEIAVVEDVESILTFSDPYLGNYDASVTVIEYFDPNCSHCKDIHPIMKSMVEQYGDSVRFFMIPMALWEYSLPQIESLYVAAQDDKYHEMLDLQFEMQHPGGLTEEEIRQITKQLDLDPDQFIARVKRGIYRQQIMDRRKQISDLGVTGTPSVMINGQFVDGASKSEECLNELIQAELAK